MGTPVDKAFLSSSKPKIDPELDNFLGRVDEVSEIIRGLASDNPSAQQKALLKADILIRDDSKDIDENNAQYRVTSSRTVINKSNDGDMNQNAFMRMMEKDANDRAQNRRERKEKSDAFRKIGNTAFTKQNYAEALSCYNQAIDLIKDSPCLYNNRALTYIRIGIFSKAIEDCDRAIDLAEYSLKARLLKAKAFFLKAEPEKSKDCLRESEEKYPDHIKMIKSFEKDLFDMKDTYRNSAQEENDFLGPEKLWRRASFHELAQKKE